MMFSLFASEPIAIPKPISMTIENFVAFINEKSSDRNESNNISRLNDAIKNIIESKGRKKKFEILRRLQAVQNYIDALPSGSCFTNYAQITLGFMQLTSKRFNEVLYQMWLMGENVSLSTNRLCSFLLDPRFQDQEKGIENFLDMLESENLVDFMLAQK